jgi:iron(III) transport system substrate-binding protein
VPTNGSFQSFVSAMRELLGEQETRDWLTGMQANEPKVFDGNGAAVEAVASGDVDAALVNHYYILEAQEEAGTDLPLANHFFESGDPGSLVNVAGVGILQTASHPVAAQTFVDYLLSEEGQTYFASAEWEYPLAAGVAADDRLIPLEDIPRPDIDLADLADLEGTLRMLQEVGII